MKTSLVKASLYASNTLTMMQLKENNLLFSYSCMVLGTMKMNAVQRNSDIH